MNSYFKRVKIWYEGKKWPAPIGVSMWMPWSNQAARYLKWREIQVRKGLLRRLKDKEIEGFYLARKLR